jgi:RNA-directed DNA polymerase
VDGTDDEFPPILNENCDQVQFALTIPTVLDRFIQQAVMQILQGRWDQMFSEHSYGFRPGRSAHQAVEAAQQYQADGHRWVVDLDLEKFLDVASYCPLIHEVLSNKLG